MKFRLLLTALTLVLFPTLVPAKEDYRCKKVSGCKVRIVEDGTLVWKWFRRGDLISTEAGWVVDPADGWIKVPHGVTWSPQGWNFPSDLSLVGLNIGLRVRGLSMPALSLVAYSPVSSSVPAYMPLAGLDDGTVGKTLFLMSRTTRGQ